MQILAQRGIKIICVLGIFVGNSHYLITEKVLASLKNTFFLTKQNVKSNYELKIKNCGHNPFINELVYSFRGHHFI
jgi:hypothetical protein